MKSFREWLKDRADIDDFAGDFAKDYQRVGGLPEKIISFFEIEKYLSDLSIRDSDVIDSARACWEEYQRKIPKRQPIHYHDAG